MPSEPLPEGPLTLDTATHYATQAEVSAYIGSGWVPPVSAEFDRLIQEAERDVDSIAGSWTLEDNGLKFGHPKTLNEKGLTPGEVIALQRATCAQVEYRVEMGSAFFVKDQYELVRGPDFERRGELGYIGPKVWRELDGTNVIREKSTRIGSIVIGTTIEDVTDTDVSSV